MSPLHSDANTRRLIFAIDPGTDCIGVCVADAATGDVLLAFGLRAESSIKERELLRKGGAGWRQARITSLVLAVRDTLEMNALWPKKGDIIAYESPNAFRASVVGVYQFVGAALQELLARVTGGGRWVLIHEIHASTIKKELGITARDTAQMKVEMIRRARENSNKVDANAKSYSGLTDAYKITEAMCDAWGVAQTARVIEVRITEGIKTDAYEKKHAEVIA